MSEVTQEVLTCDNAIACKTPPITDAGTGLPSGWSTLQQAKVNQPEGSNSSVDLQLCRSCTAALQAAVPVMCQ
jgi:hypothetical protein